MATLQLDERQQKIARVVVPALAVGLALEAKTVAYNNYGPFSWGFLAVELAVALVGVLCTRFVPDLTQQGRDFATGLVPSQQGLLWQVLCQVPSVLASAAVVTALLSVVNVAIAPQVFFNSTVVNVPGSIVACWLADVPTTFVVLLAVRLLLEGRGVAAED